MPKWDKYLDDEGTPSFEKFDKTVKNGRRILKKDDEIDLKQKEQLKRKRDEERASKRGDEV